MRRADNALETISAAATAITFTRNNRENEPSVQKRRWGSCWSGYWCFGSYRHSKKITHAVFASNTTAPVPDVPAAEDPSQTPLVIPPFAAPPSSPVSFLQSETPSVTQSPSGLLSLTPVSSGMCSPGGPASIFAIGPYANDTHLVSPPVLFSTFTTEPSTAPFTPPPESVHLTMPSSPEVPFARLLDPNPQNGEAGKRFTRNNYEFHSYQLQPGSPIGHLISPSSGISGSGTSTPFPESEFASVRTHFHEFLTGNSSQLLYFDKLSALEWGSRQGSGILTPDAVEPRTSNALSTDCQEPGVAHQLNSINEWTKDEMATERRVSFEITEEEIIRCLEKPPMPLPEATSASLGSEDGQTKEEENSHRIAVVYACPSKESSDATSEKSSESWKSSQHNHKEQSPTLRSVKEFNFNSMDGVSPVRPNIRSDWWGNEKVIGNEIEPCKNWSAFPIMQSG